MTYYVAPVLPVVIVVSVVVKKKARLCALFSRDAPQYENDKKSSVSICEICGITPSVKIMEKLQKIMAVAVVLFGVTLITVSFLIPPAGVIDPTVLTAFGETLTFAGALLGIDAHYKSKK